MRPLPQGASWLAKASPARRARADRRARRSSAATRTARLIGAIVAGGESSRFGGEPKGLQRVGEPRIIDRVTTALRAVTSRLILVSNAPDAKEWLSDAMVVRDLRPERGSLVGIHTALSSASDRVLVVAWDMPFVTPDLLRAVADAGARAEYAAIPEGPNGLEPFCAAYTPACLPLIEHALDARDLRLSALIDSLPSVERISRSAVAEFGDPARLFFNVNTPADLARAKEWASC